MKITDQAIKAIEGGAEIVQYQTAIKQEVIGGTPFYFIGFDEMWVWGQVLAAVRKDKPEIYDCLLAGIAKYNHSHL